MIGDAAAEAALDALCFADVAPEKRPILTHCQVMISSSSGITYPIIKEI